MAQISDRELRELLARDAAEGWHVFITQYTPDLLAFIQQAGVIREDDAMDVYVRVCEHLADDDGARLRRHDPGKGALGAWLRTVVQNVVVDWLRSERGRRRLFQSIKRLDQFDQRVFELRYWQWRQAAEIAELLAAELQRPVTMSDVFDAFERIDAALSSRQRAELLSTLGRRRAASSVEDEVVARTLSSHAPSVEYEMAANEDARALGAALRGLPAEDSLIALLLFVDGLSRAQVERALHITPITRRRTRGILARLRELLERQGVAR